MTEFAGKAIPEINYGALRVSAYSLGMTQRRGFLALPPEVQAGFANKHPLNQDAYYTGPAGMLVADGLSTSPKGGEAAWLVCTALSNFLLRHAVFNQRPETVVAMTYEAADAADRALARAFGQDGSTTVTGYIPTADPHQWVGLHAGDSRGIHARQGLVAGRTIDQVLPDETQGGKLCLVNCFSGRGRLDETKLRQTKYAAQAELMTDRIELVTVQAGDWLIAHTDGLGIIGDDGARTLEPEVIAAEANHYSSPALAVAALMELPDRLTDEAELGYPVLDDLTIAAGRLMLSGRTQAGPR
jgi:hypothetical protein